jgi:hypothetical protein
VIQFTEVNTAIICYLASASCGFAAQQLAMLTCGVVTAGGSRRTFMQAGGGGLVEGQGQDGSCSWAPSQSCPGTFSHHYSTH